MDKQPVFLKVYQSGQLVTSRQFLLDQISIGSSSDGPSLVLEDPSVCFWHALIEKRGDSYHISDLGSPTGTFVNSEQVLEAPLKHGDKIKVGNFEVQFFIGVPFARKQMGVKTKVASPPPPQQEFSQESKKKVSAPPKKSKPPDPEPPVEPLSAPPIEDKPQSKEEPLSELIFSEDKEDSENSASLPETEQELQKLYTPTSASEESAKESSPMGAPSEDKLSPLKRHRKGKKEEETGVSVLKKEEILPASSVSPPVEDQTAAYEEQQIVDVEPSPSFTQNSKGTYAPESEIKDLDKDISPGSGSVVEVIVAWKERALSVHHFNSGEQQTITFGSDPKANIFCTNLVGKSIYTLLKIQQNTVVCLSDGVKASLISNKGKYSFDQLVEKGLITTSGSYQFISLGQSQLVRLDFSSTLRVYVRYSNRVPKAVPAGLFNFSFSEMMGVMMSFFFMSMLVFYLALFSPQFLDSMEDLEEEGIKKASIEFKKKRIIKLKMADAPKKHRKKLSIPNKRAPKRKKVGIKKRGSKGRLGQVAAKPKEKSKKKTITSARPGGSVTTKKSGASARSPRPDPTKVGLLGFFGKKGAQKELDKAYSGTGELAGLAEAATGYAGQKESYTGEGIGTKFKNTGAGGKGSNLIGVSSGIRTKGRGGGTRGYGTGGSLGSRGSVSLSLGTDDWEVEGGIDKNAILRVIRRNKHQLEWCYETALQKKPNLEGKVLLQWDIVNEKVRAVKVRSNSTRDSILARCLMSRLKHFRFPGTGLQKGQIGEVNIPFAVTKK